MKTNKDIHLTELLVAYLSGNADKQGSLRAEHLIHSSIEAQEEYRLLKNIWTETHHIRPQFPSHNTQKALDIVHKKIEKKERLHRQRSIKYAAVAAAAVALILLTLNFLWKPTQSDKYIVVQTAEKPVKTKLPDGTLVDLNTGAALSKTQNYDRADVRKVRLQGEAFFEVKDEQGKTFIVETQAGRIEVLGTSFNVNSQNQRLEVYVKTGTVRMYSPENSEHQTQSILLTQNEIGVYSKKEGLIKVPSKPDNANTIYRIDKSLYFENTELEEVFKTLDAHYAQKPLASPEILSKRFTGSFHNDSVEHIIKVLAVSFQLEYTIQDDQYILYEPNN